MKDTSKKALRRGHNEGNIRQRADGRWEVRLSAGIDYKTGKPRRTSTCCNTRQEAIAILQQQAHEVRTQGWRDPMSVTLGEWYEYWLGTYIKDTVKQSTYASYRSYLNKHFCVLGKILLKKLEPHTLQEFYNYKFREEGLSPKTLRNYHMALHKCLQQAVKERLLIYNPCDAVTLPSGEKPEIVVFTNDQQRALVQASYRHRYGVFIRLNLCTGLRMGELLALKWEDIDFSTAQLHVRRTINRLAKYEAHDGENKTEIVFGTPKTKNSRRTIPLTRTMVDELARWKQQQTQDKIRAGDKYTDDGFIVTNEFGHYFEQKTFKDYYDRLLKDADIGHFTFHALRHPYVKHTTKIFSLRLMDFQAQAYPDARRKTRGACQLLRVGQSRSPVRPLCNRKQFSCSPPQSKMSWILYAISMRLSGYTSTRSISSSASSVVSASASKIALDAFFRLSCRACSSCFCFACANTAA